MRLQTCFVGFLENLRHKKVILRLPDLYNEFKIGQRWRKKIQIFQVAFDRNFYRNKCLSFFSELTNITLVQLFSIGIFFYAWIHELEAHKIFASVKRKSSGSHSVPHGDWFKYVSCPHYFAEILIYLSQVMILGVKHKTACLIFGWVLTNQIIAGLMNHWWYRENFKNYPTNRKAIIPFVL